MLGRSYGIILHLALLALCGLTLILVQQNRRFHTMLNPELPPEKTGYLAPAIDVTRLDGTTTTLAWQASAQERLLFVFTTTCPACRQNQDNWQALHLRMGNDFDIIGVSLDPLDATAAYRNEHDLPFEVFALADRASFLQNYGIAGVPFTIYIGADGRVHGAWRGILSTDQVAQIEANV